MTWDELRVYLKNKTFLIDLTLIDKDENIIELYQTSGKVYELTNDGIFKFIRSDKSIFQLPYDKDTIKATKEGEYREKGTGNIIINPDFITTWEVIVQNEKDTENIKHHGYFKYIENNTLTADIQKQGSLKQGSLKQEFSKILPPWKFILLSISTFGIYELVWLYKYWKILKKSRGLNISPFWRTFFSPLFVGSFAGHLKIYLREKDIPCNYSPLLIGGSYFALMLLCKLPDPYWMISFLTIIPLLPLLHGINQAWKKQEQDLPLKKFTWGQIILIVFGISLFLLLVNDLYHYWSLLESI